MPDKQTEPIPIEIRRRLLIECGFKCSIPQCQTEWPTLQFHYIDGNLNNHRPGNLLVLCPTCKRRVAIDQIDRKTCEALKGIIQALGVLMPSQTTGCRSNILHFLLAELSANLHLIAEQDSQDREQNHSYPRMRHIVLDEAIASGVFIYDHDIELFNLLYDLSTNINDLNHRLDLIEFRLPPNDMSDFQGSQVYAKTGQRCIRVITYILEDYGQMLGIDLETEFFGAKLKKLIKPQ